MAKKGTAIVRRRARNGWAFISLWLIGFVVFFAWPLVQTLIYSFEDLVISQEGGFQNLPLEAGWFSHYVSAFTKDPDFVRLFADNLRQTAIQAPAVVAFSLFIAIVLNQKFRGRTFMRAIFFLPVIVTTGIISSIIRDSVNNVAQTGEAGSNIFNAAAMTALLYQTGLPDNVVSVMSALINSSVDVVWLSGVQILLFISGLLSIPQTYYEVASVEGATKWESFWKITFPIILPYVLVNLVYTIIDGFSNFGNQTMQYIVNTIYVKGSFSYGAALSWIYFLGVMAIIAVVYLLLNRRISRGSQ